MDVYAKRIYFLQPDKYPIVGFSRQSDRDAFVRSQKPGDALALFAATTSDADESDRGRLLGVGFFSSEKQDLDWLESLPGLTRKEIEKDGMTKWQHWIVAVRMWRFDNPPIAKKFFNGSYSDGINPRAKKLEEHDAEKIMREPAHEIRIPIEVRLNSDPARALYFEAAKPPPAWQSL